MTMMMMMLMMCAGVELARTVSELRAQGQRLDDERRSAVDELTTTRHRLDELRQRIAALQSQLDNSSSQARSFQRLITDTTRITNSNQTRGPELEFQVR